LFEWWRVRKEAIESEKTSVKSSRSDSVQATDSLTLSSSLEMVNEKNEEQERLLASDYSKVV
jgi:hypothetical protein